MCFDTAWAASWRSLPTKKAQYTLRVICAWFPQTLASRDWKVKLSALNFQTGAWELAQTRKKTGTSPAITGARDKITYMQAMEKYQNLSSIGAQHSVTGDDDMATGNNEAVIGNYHMVTGYHVVITNLF